MAAPPGLAREAEPERSEGRPEGREGYLVSEIGEPTLEPRRVKDRRGTGSGDDGAW